MLPCAAPSTLMVTPTRGSCWVSRTFPVTILLWAKRDKLLSNTNKSSNKREVLNTFIKHLELINYFCYPILFQFVGFSSEFFRTLHFLCPCMSELILDGYRQVGVGIAYFHLEEMWEFLGNEVWCG